MATETKTRRVYFCAACGHPIHFRISFVEDPSVPMKDGSPSAFHANCYAENSNRVARFSGFWPEEQRWKAKIVKAALRDERGRLLKEDSVPLFEIAEEREKQHQESPKTETTSEAKE